MKKMLTWVLVVGLSAGAVAGKEATDVSAGNCFDLKCPPVVRYKIDCEIIPSTGTIRGSQIVQIKNDSTQAVHRLALSQPKAGKSRLAVQINGKSVSTLATVEGNASSEVRLVELPEVLLPGRKIELRMEFEYVLSAGGSLDRGGLADWYPRVWWGFFTCDDYDVKIAIPRDYSVGTSGRYDPVSGYYRASRVRQFGLWIGRGMKMMEARAGEVAIRCFYTDPMEPCSRVILSTAVDAVNYYRKRFGFYPQPCLTIVPGMDRPAGGYPVATSLVAIHGQERMAEMPLLHWQWITAHEIGHQYWGEYVLEKDDPGWLWIGLGVYTDRGYIRDRGLGLQKHRQMMGRYVAGVEEGLDTTVARTPEQMAQVKFDFNNIVIHGKGYSIISSLGCVLGPDLFERIIQRCLKEFGGRRLGGHEFQAVCEDVSGQDLGWFFDQWVRSNKFLGYEITFRKCTKGKDNYLSQVEIKSTGSLRMPVPVTAYFDDGTRQRKFTDRLLDPEVLEFTSSASLKTVILDAEGELPLIGQAPSSDGAELADQVRRLPWTGAGKQALDLFGKAQKLKPQNETVWVKLGLGLYDGKYYPESLQAFEQAGKLTKPETGWWVGAVVWQGHLLDLLGRREEAVRCYREALKRINEGSPVELRHDQYGIKIDKKWVDARLKKPFIR